MKKRLLSALLCLCMVVCMMPTVSLAADDSGVESSVTWSIKNGTLTISGTGDMEDYGYNGAPWADEQESIKQVVIEDGVTSIGEWAFGYCRDLAKITLPKTMTGIGDNAFNECNSLTSITIPDGVTSLGEGVFANCASLKTVTIPASVSHIELGWLGAFSGCESLTAFNVNAENKALSSDNGVLLNGDKTEVLAYPQGKSGSYTVPNGVKTIKERAFYMCNNLVSVTLPASVESIEKEAFSTCQNSLTTVKMTNGLTSIGENAFYNCPKLESADIPSTVTNIGSGAFSNCPALTEAVIPNGVTRIESGTFSSSSGLKSVTIPDSVTSIGSSAFADCKSLNDITIPDSVTSIESSAFDGTGYADNDSNWKDNILYCSHWVLGAKEEIAEANIPDGMIGIAEGTFSYCNSLTNVVIPDGVVTIGESAFLNCSNLKNLSIPASVVNIGEDAFGIEMTFDFDTFEMERKVVDGFVANVKPGSEAEKYCKENEIQFENEHNPKPVEAVEATCTEAGHKAGTKCETCGAVLEGMEEIPATGHSFTTKESDKLAAEATCTEAAKYYVQCDNCDAVSEDKTVTVGNPKGHSFTTKASDKLAAEATCTEAAKYYVQCDNCDAVSTDKTVSVGNPKGHSFNEKASGKIATEATCTEAAKYYVQCDNCDEVSTDKTVSVGNAKGHSFTNYVYNNDAKPGADGTETAKCDRCDATDTRTASGTAKPVISFTDVSSDQYYAEAVQWAVANEITNGMGDNKFEPDTTCTRGQIVTFLWRAKGQPEPTSNYNPFTDVPANAYYYKAVLWAVEQGITTGTSATTFSPDAGCTRAQVATFLCRAEGEPSGSGYNPFVDVDTSEYYGNAVLWAVSTGITTGISATEFAPNAVCTRGQIVTFLWRDMK